MVNLSEVAVLFSKGNNLTASTLKTLLRDNGYDLVYVKSVSEMLDIIVKQGKCLLFVDKSFSVYRYLFKELIENSELFKNSILAYVDNNESKYKGLINSTNYFRLTEKFERAEVLTFLDKGSRIGVNVVDTTMLNEELSVYLLKLGFSPRLIGFNYIKHAIINMVENGFKMGTLQNDVYKNIGLTFKTPPVNIERNICSSIKHALKNTPDLNSLLNINPTSKITCKELLAILLDKTQRCLKAGKHLYE